MKAKRTVRLPNIWPPTYLKYLFIWPIIHSYRRKTRTSLSWRLAGSHFGTVLLSVLTICIVGVTIVAIASRLALPRAAEASVEAQLVAMTVEGIREETSLSDDELTALFKGLQSGQLSYNYNQDEVTIQANAGPLFQNVRSISYVDSSGVVRASSDPELVSTSASAIDPVVSDIVGKALTDTDLSETSLSDPRTDGEGILGTYPVHDAEGNVTGAILIDKTKQTVPEGLAFLWLVLTFAAQIGALLLVLVGVPAIPIGIFVGIRRARAISRPVFELAEAADAFAAGDLDSRVRKIRGKDELAELQRGFNGMADLLQTTLNTEAEQRTLAEHALASNRDLIANVSHELRTPVALIRGHLEALEEDPESKDAYIRIALREADRLERLVDDLFQLSRLEANRLELDIAPFDAGAAVRSAVESLVEPARREAGLTVMASVDAGDLTCRGDRLRIEQVLLNLIRNAIHFTEEGGIILVSAEKPSNNQVRITVRDTGIGIDPEHLPLLFDRFYRAEQSRGRASGGAGLGLAIAKEMVTAMGGTIAVESLPGEGTTFTIELMADGH